MICSFSMQLRMICLFCVVLSTAGIAQEDEDLTPLTPLNKLKASPKAKPKSKPAVKPKPKAKVSKTPEDELAPITPLTSEGHLWVKVATNLASAKLWLDGKELGELPLPAQKVTAGEHTVLVQRPGYAAFLKKIVVQTGKTLEVEAKLSAVSAVLIVRSDLLGAEVLLNDKPIGVTPLSGLEVPPGPAELVVRKDGQQETRQLMLIAGRDHLLELKLDRASIASSDRPTQALLEPRDAPAAGLPGTPVAAAVPVTQRWYFWAAVGAGVAAAAAGISAGVVASQPPRQLTAADICSSNCAGVIQLP